MGAEMDAPWRRHITKNETGILLRKALRAGVTDTAYTSRNDGNLVSEAVARHVMRLNEQYLED